MKTYKFKPVEIKAIQLLPNNVDEVYKTISNINGNCTMLVPGESPRIEIEKNDGAIIKLHCYWWFVISDGLTRAIPPEKFDYLYE